MTFNPKATIDLDPPARVEEIAMAKMIRAAGLADGRAIVATASLTAIIKAQRETLVTLGYTWRVT